MTASTVAARRGRSRIDGCTAQIRLHGVPSFEQLHEAHHSGGPITIDTDYYCEGVESGSQLVLWDIRYVIQMVDGGYEFVGTHYYGSFDVESVMNAVEAQGWCALTSEKSICRVRIYCDGTVELFFTTFVRAVVA